MAIRNVGYYRHRLRVLFGSFPITWGFDPREHIRFCTVRDFKWWCEKGNKARFSYRVDKIYSCMDLPILGKLASSWFSAVLVYVLDA